MKWGVVKPVSDSANGFVSSIFPRQKKGNKHRLILSLKKFNENVTYKLLKMDNLSTDLNMIRKDCFMATFDLNYTYYSVPEVLTDQKIIIFQIWGSTL